MQNEQIHGSWYNLQPGSSYFVRILATHRAKTIRTNPTRFETEPELKLWWENTAKANGSWRTSPWLGTFLPDSSGWIYHSEMEWLYAQAGPEGDLWLWQPKLGWLWTAQGVFHTSTAIKFPTGTTSSRRKTQSPGFTTIRTKPFKGQVKIRFFPVKVVSN